MERKGTEMHFRCGMDEVLWFLESRGLNQEYDKDFNAAVRWRHDSTNRGNIRRQIRVKNY